MSTTETEAALLGAALLLPTGDGPNATIIQAGIDFGALSAPLGVPLLSCGDPNGTQGNSLGRYQPSG